MTLEGLFSIRRNILRMQKKIDTYCHSPGCDMEKACDMISYKLSLIKIYKKYYCSILKLKKGRLYLLLGHYKYNKGYNNFRIYNKFKEKHMLSLRTITEWIQKDLDDLIDK